MEQGKTSEWVLQSFSVFTYRRAWITILLNKYSRHYWECLLLQVANLDQQIKLEETHGKIWDQLSHLFLAIHYQKMSKMNEY
jgi:hypothetical protein